MIILTGLPSEICILKKSPLLNEGISVISVMRDESYFLQHFLSHYRNLGISNFIIYADRCSEEFLTYLESQDDVSILTSKNLKYGDKVVTKRSGYSRRFGPYFKELISNSLFENKWHLIVDADEFLMIPPKFLTINEYVEYLDDKGQFYSFAPMVDFFPRTIAARNFSLGISPFEGSPFFDRGPYHVFEPQLGRIITQRDGVRTRLVAYLIKNQPNNILKKGINLRAYRRPLNYKYPLIKTSNILKRVGTHEISSSTTTFHSSVLCHFKFYPGIDKKISTAINEQQYADRSVEYMFLKIVIDEMSDVDLVFDGSAKFRRVKDLVINGFFDN